jgi:hypothetical protein
MVRPGLVPVLVTAAILLAGCGYAGDPKPPALRRPMKISDLSVVERGAKIVIAFTLPAETTEGLPITGSPDVELRAGIAPAPWSQSSWETSAERVAVPEHRAAVGASGATGPPPASGRAPNAKQAAKPGTRQAGKAPVVVDKAALRRTVQLDAAKYTGKTLAVGVRVHGPQGRDDGWVIASLEVLPVLPVPLNLKAADAPDAVHLQWTADAPAFRIFRRLASERLAPEKEASAEWAQIGESTQASFDDKAFDYGKKWQYYVQSVRKVGDNWMESDASPTIEWTPKDIFPPAVPTGLVVISGVRTIELSWDPVSDNSLKGYRVYRNGKQVGGDLTTPAYSDKDVVTGTKYSYQVSAVDEAGNESQKCAPMDTTLQ